MGLGRSPFFLRVRLSAVVSVLALGTGLGAWANPALLPPMNSDRERAAYLLWIDETYPTLLDHQTTYEADLFGVIQGEMSVIQRLEALGTLDRRTSGGLFTAYSVQKVAKPPVQSDHAFSWSPATWQKIEASFQSGGYRGALVGLVNLLPPPERKALFSLPPGDLVAALREKLPDDVVAAGFDPKPHKLEASVKNDILAAIDTRIGDETRLLASCAEELVAYAKDQRIVVRDDSFKAWFDQALSTRKLSSAEGKQMEELRKQLKKSLAADGVFGDEHLVVHEVRSVLLKLREVPPHIGIFRGWAGGDCSSQYSYAYPWSPYERVYFVYDHEDRIKGYVSATIVATADHPKTLYVHSINGARISENDAAMILKLLYSLREKIGVTKLAIPTMTQVHSTVNYETIRVAFSKFRVEANKVSVKHHDLRERAILDSAVRSSTYDAAANNQIAYHVTRPEIERVAVSANGGELRFEGSQYAWTPGRTDKINPAQLYLQKSVSVHTNNAYLKNKIGGFLRLDSDTEYRWNELFENRKKRNYDHYLEHIRAWFDRRELRFEDYQRRIEPLLFDGMTRAPDAFSGAGGQRRRTRAIQALLDPALSQKAAALIQQRFEDLEEGDIQRILKLAVTANENAYDSAKVAFLTGLHPSLRTRWEVLFENSNEKNYETYRREMGEWFEAQRLNFAEWEPKLAPILQKGDLRAPDYFRGADGTLRLTNVISSLIEPGTRATTVAYLGNRFESIGIGGIDALVAAALPATPEHWIDSNLLGANPAVRSRYDTIFANVDQQPAAVYERRMDEWIRERGLDRNAVLLHSAIQESYFYGLERAADVFDGPEGLNRLRSLYPLLIAFGPTQSSDARAKVLRLMKKYRAKIPLEELPAIARALEGVEAGKDLSPSGVGVELPELTAIFAEKKDEVDAWFGRRIRESDDRNLNQKLFLCLKDRIGPENRLAHFLEYVRGIRAGESPLVIDWEMLISRDFYASKEGNAKLLEVLEVLKRLNRNENILGLKALTVPELHRKVSGTRGVFGFGDLYRMVEKDIQVLQPSRRLYPLQAILSKTDSAENLLTIQRRVGTSAIHDSTFRARGKYGMDIDGAAWIARHYYAHFAKLRPSPAQIEAFITPIVIGEDVTVGERIISEFVSHVGTEAEFKEVRAALAPLERRMLKAKKGDFFQPAIQTAWARRSAEIGGAGARYYAPSPEATSFITACRQLFFRK